MHTWNTCLQGFLSNRFCSLKVLHQIANVVKKVSFKPNHVFLNLTEWLCCMNIINLQLKAKIIKNVLLLLHFLLLLYLEISYIISGLICLDNQFILIMSELGTENRLTQLEIFPPCHHTLFPAVPPPRCVYHSHVKCKINDIGGFFPMDKKSHNTQ